MKEFLFNSWNILSPLFQKIREQNHSSHTCFMFINENEYWNQLMFKIFILFFKTSKILKTFNRQTSMWLNSSKRFVSQILKTLKHDFITKIELLLTWSNKYFQTRTFTKPWNSFRINNEIFTQNFIMTRSKIQNLIWKLNILIYGTSCNKWKSKVQR